jgi:hypothetical protein
MRFLFQ